MKNFFKIALSVVSLVLCNTLVVGCATSTTSISSKTMAIKTSSPTKLRIATFNVSMEALNYVEHSSNSAPKVSGNELTQALQENNLQIKNIAEIIQYINPDIILLNEFDRVDNNHENIHYFIEKYLNIGQNKQIGIHYPFFYQGTVNTGLTIKTDKNHVGQSGSEVAPSSYPLG